MSLKNLYYINLYKKEVIDTHPIFSWNGLILSIIVSLILVVLGVLSISYKVSESQKIIEETQTQADSIEAKLGEITKLLSSDSVDQNLVLDVQRLEQVRQDKMDMLLLLERVSLGNREGFSSYFRGISNRWQKGMWLTTLKVDAARNEFHISGNTLRANEVAKFIKNISREPVYEKKSFQSISLIRDEASGGLKFNLMGQ